MKKIFIGAAIGAAIGLVTTAIYKVSSNNEKLVEQIEEEFDEVEEIQEEQIIFDDKDIEI